MEQYNAEARQVGDRSRTTQKGENAEPERPKFIDPKGFMESHYDEFITPPQFSGMEQYNLEAKQVGEQIQTPQKGENAEPESPKLSDTKKLIEFMESHYDEFVAPVQTFDEFYHSIFELIEMFCEERGQLQYRIPEKRILEDAYKKHHRSEGELKKEEFVEISKEVVKVESFTLGKATMEFGMFLFGAPACAFLAKRILPGLGWLSDDIVIPLATSGSVAYLIKSKRL